MTAAPPVVDLAVAEALDAFATWSVRRTAARDISLSAAATLATLARDGPLRVSALAVREGIAQPSMTALLTRLERAGLAVRTPDPQDGRAVVVVATDAGRALLAERRTQRARRLEALLAELDPADRALVAAAAPALARLARRDGTPPSDADQPVPDHPAGDHPAVDPPVERDLDPDPIPSGDRP